MAWRIMALSSGSCLQPGIWDATKIMTGTVHRWDEIGLVKITEMMSQKIVAGSNQMLAQTYLKQGALVPRHAHASEQMTYVLQGAVRFVVGRRRNHRARGRSAAHSGDGRAPGRGAGRHVPAGRLQPGPRRLGRPGRGSLSRAEQSPGRRSARPRVRHEKSPVARRRGAAAAVSLAACEIRVARDEDRHPTDVDVDTPLGDLSVTKDAVPEDVGVRVYPGARPLEDGDETDRANVFLSTARSWTCGWRR